MNPEQITLISAAVTVVVAVAGGLWAMVKYLREFGKEFGREMQSLREEFRGEIQSLRVEFRGEIQSVREEVRGEIQSLRMEFRGEIQSVREEMQSMRTEMREEFRAIRTEMKSETGRLENRITHIDQKLDFIGYGYDFTQTPPKKLRTRRLVKTEE
ncbi:MAG: CCDC90 family protein [Tannerella sp.]|nr:CCDC90 family protein [Tannerella sp.]